MPRVLIFDLKAKMAHFRLPDTTVTHASYPFIPRTALHGLLASILGLERLDEKLPEHGENETIENYVGLRLMSKVQSSFQKVSMMGKGWAGTASRETFNKPVSIEILVNPHYRIYYTGSHLVRLEAMIRTGRSTYHTYMGSCYCLVFPKYVDTQDAVELGWPLPENLRVSTVIPSFAVAKILPQPGQEYARAGGVHYHYLGKRQFQGTLNLVYEVKGEPINIKPHDGPFSIPIKFMKMTGGEIICLW